MNGETATKTSELCLRPILFFDTNQTKIDSFRRQRAKVGYEEAFQCWRSGIAGKVAIRTRPRVKNLNEFGDFTAY